MTPYTATMLFLAGGATTLAGFISWDLIKVMYRANKSRAEGRVSLGHFLLLVAGCVSLILLATIGGASLYQQATP